MKAILPVVLVKCKGLRRLESQTATRIQRPIVVVDIPTTPYLYNFHPQPSLPLPARSICILLSSVRSLARSASSYRVSARPLVAFGDSRARVFGFGFALDYG